MLGVHSSDKLPVVFDIGTSYTKAGYAGDSRPICVVPTSVMQRNETIWLRDVAETTTLRDHLRTFLRNIYLKQMLLSMNERSVIVCESILGPLYWKQAIAQVLLLDFGVPSVIFAPRHLLSLYTRGIQTGLVIHSGYMDCSVIPIYENMVMLNAWQALPIGGEAIEKNLAKLLSELATIEKDGNRTLMSDTQESLTNKQLEDIKVRACFVTPYKRALNLRQSEKGESKVETPDPPKDVSYPLRGDAMLSIPGRVRELACEVLYDKATYEQTLARLVLESILQSPVDARRQLAENIYLIGGTCMLPGFKHRLLEELQHLAQEYKENMKMDIQKFCFHSSPVGENYTAWLGGAIMGSCGNLESYSLTKEKFLSAGEQVPDWSNFEPDTTSYSPRSIQ